MCSNQGYPYQVVKIPYCMTGIARDRGRRKYSKTCACGPKSDIETRLCQELEDGMHEEAAVTLQACK
jgi:hypothetical protein